MGSTCLNSPVALPASRNALAVAVLRVLPAERVCDRVMGEPGHEVGFAELDVRSRDTHSPL